MSKVEQVELSLLVALKNGMGTLENWQFLIKLNIRVRNPIPRYLPKTNSRGRVNFYTSIICNNLQIGSNPNVQLVYPHSGMPLGCKRDTAQMNH